MTWRRVGLVYAVLAVLIAVAFVSDRWEVAEDAPPPPDAAVHSLLEREAGAVAAVTFTRAGRLVRAAKTGGRWQAVEPQGSRISPDLIEATIATLTAGQASEMLVAEATPELAAFGLDAPSATVEVVLDDAPNQPITVAIGAKNPTRTAVYARRSDRPGVFLVGMNLSYYIDLIFDAATG
jgi:hypothetical protein